MAYKAGDLNFTVEAINSNAVNSLDTVIAKLSSLSSILKTITGADFKWINSFGTKMKNLSKKMQEIDWGGFEKNFLNLANSISPFIDKINSAEKSLVALSNILQRTKKINGSFNINKKIRNNQSTNAQNQAAEKFNLGFSLATISGTIYATKRLGTAVANLIQYGVDYTETLNLWQVAMRKNLEQADEFIQKLNKVYGISQKTLMNAQATFKNILGSLGNITDSAAYAISEGVTQMALDYASLFNTTFESAFSKFQAALTGQVRPIRALSGYDITETTLYQLYQELGGTKSLRQLTVTEKRLLAINSIFNQMQRSGAIGDLSKTLDNFANQSRMLSENWKELLTYVGLYLQNLLQSWGVLKNVNAVLIFITEILKTITNIETPNFVDGIFESTTEATDAVEKLQGKLLDFDKFRALNSSQDDTSLAIDEKILNSITNYKSILESTNNQARELAESWLLALGFTKNENGELQATENIINKIKAGLLGLLSAVTVLVGLGLIGFIQKLTVGLFTLKTAMTLLNATLIGGIIYSFIRMLELFREGKTGAGLLAGAIGATLTAALILLKTKFAGLTLEMIKAKLAGKAFANSLSVIKNIGVGVLAGFASFTVVSAFLEGLPSKLQKVVSALFIVVGVLAQVAALVVIAKEGMKSGLIGASIAGIGIGAIIAGVKTISNQLKTSEVPKYANGASNIDGGTLFYAGEAGKTEVVYNGDNGKSNVANISQLSTAFYQALVRYGSNKNNNISLQVNLDGETVYKNTTSHAKRNGLCWSKI